MDILWGWNNTIHLLEEKEAPDASMFLLTLDPTKRTLRSIPYRADELALAQKRYAELEKETEKDPSIQVVLVAVETVDAIPKAYPNYYIDTSDFMAAVRNEIDG